MSAVKKRYKEGNESLTLAYQSGGEQAVIPAGICSGHRVLLAIKGICECTTHYFSC